MTTQVFTSGKLNIQHQQHNHSSGKPQQMPAPSGENEQLLFNSAIFQLYHGENKLIFNEDHLSNFSAISWREQVNFQ